MPRPPIGERAMTSTERNRLARQRQQEELQHLRQLVARYEELYGPLPEERAA